MSKKSSSGSDAEPPNAYELEDSDSDDSSRHRRKRKQPRRSAPGTTDDETGVPLKKPSKPKLRPLPTNPYQLTREQKQCTLLLSAAIRHCLLPGFSRAINAIFADAFCEEESALNPPDPIDLIDLRSREAAIRLRLLIKEAFEQIYHQLLVVGIEEVVAADDLETMVQFNDLRRLLSSSAPLSADAVSYESSSSGSESDSECNSCVGRRSATSGDEDNEARSDEEEEEGEDEEGDEEEEESDDDGPDYETMFKEMRVYNRSYRRNRHYKTLPGYRSSRRKILKLRMFKTRERMEREKQRIQKEEEEEREEENENEKLDNETKKDEVEETTVNQSGKNNEGTKEGDDQQSLSGSVDSPRSPSQSPPPLKLATPSLPPSPQPPPRVRTSQKVRKLIALVVSQAMTAAICPNLDRLIWTLRNDHVAQMDPDEVLPIDTLLRNYGFETGKRVHLDQAKLKGREKWEAKTLYGKRREKFRRAVFDTFFADPQRDPNPQTLAKESPFITPTTMESMGVERVPNVSFLQRHLMAAVMVAVRSGFLLLLDQRLVQEISSKYDIRLEKRRHIETEFSFTEADLEDDDENVTLDQSILSPLKDTENILALRRNVDMWTSEPVFRRLLDKIFAPLKKMAKMEQMKLHKHNGRSKALVNATELIDARIGLAAVILKRYFLRTVSDILGAVFQHMAGYVEVMREVGDQDAAIDVPAGTSVETTIPTGNAEFEGLYRVHIEQTLVDYRNVLVQELDRRQPKSREELSKMWHTAGLAEHSMVGVKEPAEEACKLGEPVPEAVNCLKQLLHDMYDIHSEMWANREPKRVKYTGWKQYMLDMREVTVGERSMVIAFAENLRHLFLGLFNNELRWELIVKGVEIQRYDDDSEEEDEAKVDHQKKCAKSESQQKKIVYHEAIDIWTSLSALEPVVMAIFESETREGNLAAKNNGLAAPVSTTSTSDSSLTTTITPVVPQAKNIAKGSRKGGKQQQQNNNQTNNSAKQANSTSNSAAPAVSPMPPVAPPTIPINPKLTDQKIIKTIQMIDMRASRAVHLLNAYFDDAIDIIFRQAVCYLNEFVNQVRGTKHKEIKRTIVNCLKNNIPGFSSLYSEMFNRLITAAMASYRNNLVAQLDKPSVGVVPQLVKMFNFGEIDESVVKCTEAEELAKQAQLKSVLDALFVQRCFTSWPAFEMELMAVINGPESMAHTLMKDLIREFFLPFDAELKRHMVALGITMRRPKIGGLSPNIPKANMATLKEAIRLWTSPCVIEQTFERKLTPVIRKTNNKQEAVLIDKREPPPPTTAPTLAALELIDLRACEAVHRAQARLRQAIAQYHKLLVVYFSLYLELFHFESANTKAKYLEMTHNIESINALKRISCYYVEQAICTTRNKLSKALYGYRGIRKVAGLAADYARHEEMVARASTNEFSPFESPEVEEAKSRCFRSIIESLIVLQQDIPVEWQAVDKTGAIHVLNYLLESLLCSIHSNFESYMKRELEERGIISRKELHDILAEMDETSSEEELEGVESLPHGSHREWVQKKLDELAAAQEAADPDGYDYEEEDENDEEYENECEDEEEEEAPEKKPVDTIDYSKYKIVGFEDRSKLKSILKSTSHIPASVVNSKTSAQKDHKTPVNPDHLPSECAAFGNLCNQTLREIIADHLKGPPPDSPASPPPTEETGVVGNHAATATTSTASHNHSKKGSNKSSKKKGKHNKRK